MKEIKEILLLNEEENYVIYKAENIESHQVYIGATTRTLGTRKKEHLKDALRGSKTKFHQSIATYGKDAFVWEQIDTASSKNDLAQKEKQYIIENDAKEQGLNEDSGGGFRKIVYQYSVDNGLLIKSYTSLKDAAEAINSTKQHISRVCLSVNKTCGEFFWSYEYKEPFIPAMDSRRKKVIQYTIEREFVEEYISVAQASKVTNVSKSSIAKVCRKERPIAGGYKWEYETVD